MEGRWVGMRKHFKNYFFPHAGNDYTPHVFRELSVVGIALVALLIFGLFTFQAAFLVHNAAYTAAVLPAVLVDLVNTDRQSAGQPKLTINPLLQEAARRKAEHMAAKGYFAHISPDGLTPWYWMYLSGYVFSYAGENLAVNFVDSNDVEQAWMLSPGHRANLLNTHFTEIGIAAVPGTFNGRPTVFVVQMFGAPYISPLPTSRSHQSTRTASVPTHANVATKNFVAIKNTPVDTGARVRAGSSGTEREVRGTHIVVTSPSSRLIDRIVLMPHTLLKTVYTALLLILFVALSAMIFVERRIQHPKNILYALLLIFLIAGLSYVQYRLFSAGIVIV